MALMSLSQYCSPSPPPMLLGLLRSAGAAKSPSYRPACSYLVPVWLQQASKSIAAQLTGAQPLMLMMIHASHKPQCSSDRPSFDRIVAESVVRAVSAAPTEIRESTDIQTAVEACCSKLGRPLGSAEEQLVRTVPPPHTNSSAPATANHSQQQAPVVTCGTADACLQAIHRDKQWGDADRAPGV